MLNISPTNGEDNGDGPDVIVESASEDDDIDISQFVESVLEEPEPSPSKSPPPMVYFPNQNARKSQPVFRGGVQLPVFQQPVQPALAIGPGIRQVQTVLNAVPPLHCVYPSRPHLVNNQGRSSVVNNELPSISWLKECFEKVKNSSYTFCHQVKCLEERFKWISSTSDTKKIMSFSNDLQSLLKQSELGYKYLGTTLSTDHQAWAVKTSQRRLALNMTANGNSSGNQDMMVKRQILIPLTTENKVISFRGSERIALPPNMLISVNSNNHSLSITTTENNRDQKHISELCAKYNIKPCYVLLERCDAHKGNDSDNDDVEIIEELIAL